MDEITTLATLLHRHFGVITRLYESSDPIVAGSTDPDRFALDELTSSGLVVKTRGGGFFLADHIRQFLDVSTEPEAGIRP